MPNEMMRAILVDDEIHAISELENFINNLAPSINIIGKYTNPDEAKKAIIKEKPELLFLDIQMPGKDGFQLLKEVRDQDITPFVIFVTAHNKYAIQAIKNACFEYLLKPIDEEEFNQCYFKLQTSNAKVSSLSKIEALLEAIKPTEKLKLSSKSGFILVDPDEIIYVLADSNYSEIYFLNGKKEVSTINLSKVEELLPAITFWRLNRSVLVNKKYIVKVNKVRRKCIVNADGQEFQFSISKTYLSQL